MVEVSRFGKQVALQEPGDVDERIRDEQARYATEIIAFEEEIFRRRQRMRSAHLATMREILEQKEAPK